MAGNDLSGEARVVLGEKGVDKFGDEEGSRVVGIVAVDDFEGDAQLVTDGLFVGLIGGMRRDGVEVGLEGNHEVFPI